MILAKFYARFNNLFQTINLFFKNFKIYLLKKIEKSYI